MNPNYNQGPSQNSPPPGYFQGTPWGNSPPNLPSNPIDLWKVVGMNYAIFLAYQTLLILIADDAFLMMDMLPLIMHWMVMVIFMIISFVRGKRMAGFGWLISFVSLLIVGFGSCWWIADMVDSSFM